MRVASQNQWWPGYRKSTFPLTKAEAPRRIVVNIAGRDEVCTLPLSSIRSDASCSCPRLPMDNTMNTASKAVVRGCLVWAASARSAPNLVANAGFESDLDDWQVRVLSGKPVVRIVDIKVIFGGQQVEDIWELQDKPTARRNHPQEVLKEPLQLGGGHMLHSV